MFDSPSPLSFFLYPHHPSEPRTSSFYRQVRGAFSNIPLWHALIDDLAMMNKQLANGGMFQRPVHNSPLLRMGGLRSSSVRGRSKEPRGLEQLGWAFRPYIMELQVWKCAGSETFKA